MKVKFRRSIGSQSNSYSKYNKFQLAYEGKRLSEVKMMVYAADLITDALSMIDVIAVGETPNAYWTQLGVRLLNGLFGQWQTKGIYNPILAQGEFVTTTNNPIITLGYDVSDPLTPILGDIPVMFGDITDVQIQLGSVVYRLSKGPIGEYFAKSVRQSISVPNFYALDYQLPITKLYLYPSPQVGLTVRVIGSKKIELIKESQEATVFDEIYRDAILFNLAASLYPFFKTEAGLDKEIIYKAKASVEGLRAKSIAMKMKNLKNPYYSPSNDQSYWLSPLNTIGASN